jgi:UDP-glucuronate 4-epimerase
VDAGGVEPGERFECINLGNDRPVTLNAYLALLERLLGKPVRVNQVTEHPMDARCTWADLAKARRLLGYAPATSFETALERCVTWYLREIAEPVAC